MIMDFDQKTPTGKSEFLRALVGLLDNAGYHNVAFAIARCADDYADNVVVNSELEGFLSLAKNLLSEKYRWRPDH